MPITDAGHRVRRGYRCADEAATRESENARLLHAFWSSARVVTARVAKRSSGVADARDALVADAIA
jgi:hypothetical protein